MSIKDFIGKIKPHLANIKDSAYSEESGLKIKDDIYIVLILLLVGMASYGLGIISSHERAKIPISIQTSRDYMTASVLNSTTNNTNRQTNPSTETNTPVETSGEVVASKTGTKYYYPTCSGVSRIKEENKVWFKTIEEARAHGLTPAANCPGLK